MSSISDNAKIRNGYVGSLHIPKSLPIVRSLYWFNNTGCYNECLSAARNGNADASAVVAMFHLLGAVGNGNRVKVADEWAERSAKLGNSYGQYVSALTKFELGEPTDAIEFLQKSANSKFGPAAWLLGKVYQDGIGASRNLKYAEELFRIARKRGYIFGGLALCDLYDGGEFGILRCVQSFILTPLYHIRLSIRQIVGNKLNEENLLYENFGELRKRYAPRKSKQP